MPLRYLAEAINPVFGAKHYWYMFEIAKSRGEIQFRLIAICADMQPNKHLREMEGGDSQEVADALAKWAWGPFRPPRFTLQIRQRAA